MPLRKCQRETSSREFREWRAYLNEIEPNEFHREDWLFAMLGREIRMILHSNPQSVDMKWFLPKFDMTEAEREVDLEDLTEEEEMELRRKASAMSRMFWFSKLGLQLPETDVNVGNSDGVGEADCEADG